MVGKRGLEPLRLSAHDPKSVRTVFHVSNETNDCHFYQKTSHKANKLPFFGPKPFHIFHDWKDSIQ